MALRVQHQRFSLPRWYIIALVPVLMVVVAAGWFSYRWYVHGDPVPVSLPMFVSANPQVDESMVTGELVRQHTVDPQSPRYVSIPTIGVNETRVFGMGVNDKGMLADPRNISDVAWYDQSGTPGSGGIVLMNGHNGGMTRNGVFANLHRLGAGDIIQVENGAGEMFRYEVRENQSMHLDEVNATGMQMMMESAEKGREALNIITCDGKWVPQLGQFDRRIMLRATLID